MPYSKALYPVRSGTTVPRPENISLKLLSSSAAGCSLRLVTKQSILRHPIYVNICNEIVTILLFPIHTKYSAFLCPSPTKASGLDSFALSPDIWKMPTFSRHFQVIITKIKVVKLRLRLSYLKRQFLHASSALGAVAMPPSAVSRSSYGRLFPTRSMTSNISS